MKVIKDNDLSILFKPWGYGHKYYLHLTAVFGFHLLVPETLLTEQELWGKLPLLMGDDKILDEGMPKVSGEFLVTGKCHAPAGEKTQAGRVTVSVGPLEKQLHVFGDRHWRRNHAGLQVISDPEPFSEMDLAYKNTFGGPDFEKNPLGKGLAKNGQDENGHRDLPNIELPGQEIGAPSDRPEPAGFSPIDRMWPQRFKKVGTYDEEWQKTRWPYFPADMDYTFFNMAPADQRLDGYFEGNEQFLIEGMHPEHRRIQNSLPPVRPRQFVYKKIDPKKDFVAENLIFEEALLKLDTVWFFPEALLGVLVFHGSVEIQDEEYFDVHRLYLTKASTRQDPEDLPYYREKMFASMDLSVPVDMTPFEEAAPEFESMLKQWRNVPKQIEDVKKRAMGKAPEMAYTPEETAAGLKKVIAGAYPVIGNLEQLARQMHAQYGHMTKIDLTRFDDWRKTLEEMGQRTDDVAKEAGEIREQAAQVEKQAGQKLKAQYTPEELASQGIDPDNLLIPLAANPWQAQAFSFVMQSRKNLKNDPIAMERLVALGFEQHTIERAWLGITSQTVWMNACDLGFDPDDLDEDPVNIPPGLVLPVFKEAEVSRVSVRPEQETLPDQKWLDAAGEFVLPGSAVDPVFLPACLVEDPPVVVVPEQMAALLLEQEAGDACSILWLPDTKTKLGEDEEEALLNALRILVITGSDNHKDDFEKWAAERANAVCLIIPDNQKTLFAARQQGLKIRPWILGALPEDFALAHDIEIALPKAGKAPGKLLPANLLPPIDIKGLIGKALEEVNAFYQSQKSAMGLEMEKMLDQAAKNLNIPRSELNAVMEKAGQGKPDSPGKIGRQAKERLKADKEKLRGQNQLTPGIDAEYQAAIANVEKVTAEAEELEVRFGESEKEFEEKKAQLAAGKLPDEAAGQMRALGLDPDRMRALTREEVVEMHGRRESLALYDLSGLDLSGLDLTGADLSRARCIGTLFVDTILAGATLSQMMGNEADFSGADLGGAKADMALFSDAVMHRTIFREAKFKQVAFTDANLEEADFSGAELELVSFETCKTENISFVDARLQLVVFNGVAGKSMDFTRMQGYKCLFQDCSMDGNDFSQAALPACMYMNCRGEGVVFFEADLSRASICQESAFPGCDFRHARMHESCIKDSDLSGADFRKTSIDGSFFEGCDLTGACMRKMHAPRTRFVRMNMERADMRGINLLTGSLKRSRLVNADLSSSNLYGVDLYKAEFGNTNLDGTNLKLTLLADDRKQYLE